MAGGEERRHGEARLRSSRDAAAGWSGWPGWSGACSGGAAHLGPIWATRASTIERVCRQILGDLAPIWSVVDLFCGRCLEVEVRCGFLVLGAVLPMAVPICTSWPQPLCAAPVPDRLLHLARGWCERCWCCGAEVSAICIPARGGGRKAGSVLGLAG
jgi:hypothetical protein